MIDEIEGIDEDTQKGRFLTFSIEKLQLIYITYH